MNVIIDNKIIMHRKAVIRNSGRTALKKKLKKDYHGLKMLFILALVDDLVHMKCGYADIDNTVFLLNCWEIFSTKFSKEEREAVRSIINFEEASRYKRNLYLGISKESSLEFKIPEPG